jgi:protein-arginine kinase activator protein McsA
LGKRNKIFNNAEVQNHNAQSENISEVDKLKSELKLAIEKEEYEKAAVLRDEIRKISGDK